MKKITFRITIFILCISPIVCDAGVNYYLNVFDKPKKTVVLDAGHGGHDGGASGKYKKEKDLTLQMTLKLGQFIEDNYPDVEVIYTRKTDVFLPLYQRVGIANKKKADLFISIHCNYIGSTKTKGTETFVMGLHRADENLQVAQRENEVILMENDYENNYEGFDPNSPIGHIVLSSFQDAYLEKSLNFAASVEKNFDQINVTHSRGVKQAGFAVLRRATMPSVLIETGFLSNEEEEARLGSEEGQQQIVRAIGDAMANFFTVEKNSKVIQKETKKNENLTDQYNLMESPSSSAGKYRIQIAAMKQEMDKKIIAHLEQVGKLHVFQENGYFKYQIGDFISITKAQEAMKSLAQLGYNGGFIVEKK
jgi:N-acetylmuramoyl-L-alanine amidase